MAAWVSGYGTAAFGGDNLPKAGTAALGIPTEFHVYEGLSHGFGLGTGTVAEGWIKDAVKFWEKQMKTFGTTGIRNIKY